jgi:dihydrodipicolinate synthase/N-acetylneuraminate lyase
MLRPPPGPVLSQPQATEFSMLPIPKIQYSRKPEGISAAYLPWKPVGRIDLESYERGLERTWACGLSPAINMDTGFANLLSLAQRREILQRVSRLAAGRPFVAGAFVEDLAGDMVANYQTQVSEIRSLGGIPIVFQSTALIEQSSDQIVRTYSQIGSVVDHFLGFELGKMFAPFGSIYSMDTFRKLMDIPSLGGLKHSSLSRPMEWERLACRDRDRPDFRIYTGNDLAIDMIQWGSDYLLGLSAFYPEAFAKRDDYWAAADARFYELNDALQMLGGFAFRPPVPAYKHNAAMVLAMRGVIDSDAIPPSALGRPSSDREFLEILIDRIDALMV